MENNETMYLTELDEEIGIDTESIDPYDLRKVNYLCSAADRIPLPLVGKNEEGETVMAEVLHQFLKMTTYQSNGWIRINYFYPDGTIEEMFDR